MLMWVSGFAQDGVISSMAKKEKPGSKPETEANLYAWVQHFIHHLAFHGMAGFVLLITASLNHSFCISSL